MREHIEIVKIMAPLTDNPNAPNINGETPIQIAAQNGHTETVNFLSSLVMLRITREYISVMPIPCLTYSSYKF